MASVQTYFLPADRGEPADIEAQRSVITSAPNVAAMLETVPGAATILNPQRQIVAHNRQLGRVSVPSDATFGMRVGELLHCVNADTMPGGCGTAMECRECGAAKAQKLALEGQASTQECRITATQGAEHVPLDLRVSAVPITIDHQPFIVFSTIDISDEKRRHVLERVFFNDVLSAAGNIKSMIEMYGIVDERERRDLLDQMISLAEQLVEGIRSQRELQDAERRDLRPMTQDVIIIELMRHVKGAWRFDPTAHDRMITLAGVGLDSMLTTDPMLLARVLGNLLRNAIEASVEGDVITFSYERDREGRNIFSIHNPQVMAESVQRQVFQRSFTTKGRGRGVGCYSARLITERYLSGTIEFTSEHGRGTKFRVILP